jgi:hypothetical protein
MGETLCRPHRNGIVAWAVRVAGTKNDFLVSAVVAMQPFDISTPKRVTGTLDEARREADRLTGCDPCTCPPWDA